VKYRTLVADPPWPMPETGETRRGPTDSRGVYTAKSGRTVDGAWWGRHRGETIKLPYETMTVPEISALPVGDIAEQDAHLYVWTTNRFLEATYEIVRNWGFRPAQLLTWCKPPMGVGFGGAFTTTTEFVLFARRGSLPHIRRQDSSWWCWSRPYENGHIAHSAKPEHFLDLVEQVSPGPYVELFARRHRLGWDVWGNESANTATLEAPA
jgi:N6-adenosine-specific RNA methylase IME4